MGKRAHIAVVTRVDPVWERLTELSLVLLRVVEVFHSVVTLGAGVAELTVVGLITHLRSVSSEWPSAIFLVRFMIEKAFLRIMLQLVLAYLSFKRH